MLQNDLGLLVRPVVEDVRQEVNFRMLDRLRLEEIVSHGLNARRQVVDTVDHSSNILNDQLSFYFGMVLLEVDHVVTYASTDVNHECVGEISTRQQTFDRKYLKPLRVAHSLRPHGHSYIECVLLLWLRRYPIESMELGSHCILERAIESVSRAPIPLLREIVGQLEYLQQMSRAAECQRTISTPRRAADTYKWMIT